MKFLFRVLPRFVKWKLNLQMATILKLHFAWLVLNKGDKWTIVGIKIRDADWESWCIGSSPLPHSISWASDLFFASALSRLQISPSFVPFSRNFQILWSCTLIYTFLTSCSDSGSDLISPIFFGLDPISAAFFPLENSITPFIMKVGTIVFTDSSPLNFSLGGFS